MSFSATVTSADAYRAQVGHLEECLERAFSRDLVHGVDGNDRPQKWEGVGWPPAELHQPPRLFSPNTVTAGGAATDEVKLVNYCLAAVRSIVRVFEEKGVAHSVVLSSIAVGVSADATITAIRAQVALMVTAWNAGIATLGVDSSLTLPTPPAIA